MRDIKTGETVGEPYNFKLSELGPGIISFEVIEGIDDFIKIDKSNFMIVINPK